MNKNYLHYESNLDISDSNISQFSQRELNNRHAEDLLLTCISKEKKCKFNYKSFQYLELYPSPIKEQLTFNPEIRKNTKLLKSTFQKLNLPIEPIDYNMFSTHELMLSQRNSLEKLLNYRNEKRLLLDLHRFIGDENIEYN